MFGRRRNAPFQPLGLRLQRFGRRVMRNYAPSDSGPTRPASVPVPSAWQQSASEPLLWRSPDENSAPAPQQTAPAPQPQAAPAAPEPIQAAPPPAPGAIGDEANDFNLLKILAAHESRRAPTPPAGIARKLAEATSSSEDSGDGDTIQTSRRSRSRAAFDYVKTDALRADMTPTEIQNMQRSAAKPAVTPAPSPAEDVSEASYTEIDDAGDIQRSADDSGMTDGNSADVTTADSSEDAGAPTDMLFAPPSDADVGDISPTLSPGVQREIDPDVQRMLDNALQVTPSSGEPSAPTQPGIQRQAAPSQSESAPTPRVETPRPASQPGTPIQREIGDNVTFTPAPQETRIPTPGTPAISRTADPSAVPFAANDAPTQPEPTSEVQRLLDQAMTVTPASSASSPRTETPIQRSATEAAPTRPEKTAAGTPTASTASTPNTPMAAQPAPSVNTPIQREHNPDVQQMLDQAMTVTAPAASTPIQRTPETPASAQSSATTSTPIQRTEPSNTIQTPIQREHNPDVQQMLDQAMTVTPASSASTPDAPASAQSSTPSTPETPASAQSSATTSTPIQRTETSNTTQTSIQREHDPDVQRLLDQAMTVTPASLATQTEVNTAVPTASTPIQRTPETPASAQFSATTSTPDAPVSAQPNTPIQRTEPSNTIETPIQREHDPDVQRLLDQAMTVTPSSAVASPLADTPETPTAPSTPIQRTAEPTARLSVQRTPTEPTTQPSVQRTSETPISSAGDSASFTPASTQSDAPIQRDIDPDVQRLLDQALSVTPSASAEAPAAPTAPASAAPSVQRTPETPKSSSKSARSRAAQSDTSFSAPTASTGADTPIQRDINPDVQRLLDQALTVTPAARAEAPQTSAPTSASTPTTPIQRTASQPQTPVSGPIDSGSFTPTAPTAQPSVQRTLDPNVQSLLDQALSVTPSSSAAPDAPAVTPITTSTPSVQRTSETPDTTSKSSVQRTTRDTASNRASAAVQRTPDEAAPAPSSPADESVQRTLDPGVQSLLDQALSVTPSSSAEAPAAPTTASTPPVQRTARETSSKQAAKPSIQRTPETAASSETPVQRTLDPQVQRMLDQAMGVSPSASPSAPETSQPAASTNTARPNLQRRAAPQQPAGETANVSPSVQNDPFNRTLNPDIQRRLEEAMRVTPTSPTVARSARTPLPVESRRPFIPAPPAADAAESTPTAGTPNASPVQRSAAVPPSAPKQPGTPAASSPAVPNVPPESSSSLESDLLRWMGMPADTPVEGRLSRKTNDSVESLMRKAETSTARPSEGPTSEPTPSEPAASSSNPMPASQQQSSQDMPSISHMGFRDLDDVQRAIAIDEVSSEVSSPAGAGEGGESSINDIAQRVLDILRTKLRLERERTRKF